MTRPSPTQKPPYYAVVFTSLRSDVEDGYDEMAARMAEMAAAQPGYLGFDTARGADGLGISVSYWRDADSMKAWRCMAEHMEAQRSGREKWYRCFRVHVAKVERAYGFDAKEDAG